MSKDEYFQKFCNYLDARGMQQSKYKLRAKTFIDLTPQENLLNPTLADFDNFIVILKNKNLDNSYINNYVKAIKKFYEFAIDYKYSNENVRQEIAKVRALKEGKKKHHRVKLEALPKMVEYTSYYSYNMSGYKVKAVLYFMFFGLVRPGELIRLKREDVDIERKCAIIRLPVKNSNEKRVRFNPETAEALQNYFNQEPQVDNAFNLTEAKLEALFTLLKNFDPKIMPRTMRRSGAVHYLKLGMNIRVIQKLLGHKSLETTLIYLDLDDEDIDEAYDKLVN